MNISNISAIPYCNSCNIILSNICIQLDKNQINITRTTYFFTLLLVDIFTYLNLHSLLYDYRILHGTASKRFFPFSFFFFYAMPEVMSICFYSYTVFYASEKLKNVVSSRARWTFYCIEGYMDRHKRYTCWFDIYIFLTYQRSFFTTTQ